MRVTGIRRPNMGCLGVASSIGGTTPLSEVVDINWDNQEDTGWQIEDLTSVENIDEDRSIMYPEGEIFVWDIESESE